jgi:hypothetical protein
MLSEGMSEVSGRNLNRPLQRVEDSQQFGERE